MSDKTLRWLCHIFLAIVFGIAFGYWWHYMAIASTYEETPIAGFVASDRTKAAMAYHGIRFAEQEDELVFYRNGQRCKVFTVACMEALEGTKGLEIYCGE